MVLEGKRVLLSASTHAAINNVLERIQDNDVLREQNFPLRIGDEAKARDVAQFNMTISKVNYKMQLVMLPPQLLVDSSNLVWRPLAFCGCFVKMMWSWTEGSPV